MFDVYVHAHAADPATRRRLAIAFALATAALVSTAIATVGVQRLSITRVAAPTVELDFVMTTSVPPPAAVPPPEVDHAALAEADDAEAQPPPRASRTREASPRAAGEVGEGGDGDDADLGASGPVRDGPHLLGSPPSGPPCPIPGTCSGPGPTRRAGTEARSDTRVLEPLAVVRARALAIADPSPEALARTAAALARRDLRVVISFCIDASGHTSEIRTVRSSDDAEVDRICRAAVGKWRFRPSTVAGRASTTCSETTFDIRFD